MNLQALWMAVRSTVYNKKKSESKHVSLDLWGRADIQEWMGTGAGPHWAAPLRPCYGLVMGSKCFPSTCAGNKAKCSFMWQQGGWLANEDFQRKISHSAVGLFIYRLPMHLHAMSSLTHLLKQNKVLQVLTKLLKNHRGWRYSAF